MIIGVLRSLEVALGSLVLVHGIPSFAIFVVQSITADFDFQGPVHELTSLQRSAVDGEGRFVTAVAALLWERRGLQGDMTRE